MSFVDPNRPVPEVRTGLYDLALAKNRDVADGAAMISIANLAYSNWVRRRRVVYSYGGAISAIPSGTTHRAEFYLDPEITEGGLVCTIIYGDSGVAGTARFATFNINGVAQSTPSVPANTATPTAGPSDLKRVTFDISTNLSSGVNTLDWSVSANAGIYAVVIYGRIPNPPSTGNAFAASSVLYPYAAGVPVSAVETTSLILSAWQYWCRQATHHFAWSGSFSVASATYTNIASGTATGWGTSVPGFWVIPEKQATLAGATVPCKLYCYASCTTVGAGRLRIQDSTGVLATITGIGVAGYYTADVDLNPALTQSALTVVEASCTAGTITVTGAGLYSFTS